MVCALICRTSPEHWACLEMTFKSSHFTCRQINALKLKVRPCLTQKTNVIFLVLLLKVALYSCVSEHDSSYQQLWHGLSAYNQL